MTGDEQPKAKTRRSGGSEGRGLYPRLMPKLGRKAAQRRPARYAGLRQATRPKSLAASAAINFLAAAAAMMKDVREALERAFGPRLSEAEIERRTQERERDIEARERFRLAADELAHWQELWDEQRRRADEAAQPPRMRARSCAVDIHQAFRQRAAIARPDRTSDDPFEATTAHLFGTLDWLNPYAPDAAAAAGGELDATLDTISFFLSPNP